jgi:hypothetical protein
VSVQEETLTLGSDSMHCHAKASTSISREVRSLADMSDGSDVIAGLREMCA